MKILETHMRITQNMKIINNQHENHAIMKIIKNQVRIEAL